LKCSFGEKLQLKFQGMVGPMTYPRFTTLFHKTGQNKRKQDVSSIFTHTSNKPIRIKAQGKIFSISMEKEMLLKFKKSIAGKFSLITWLAQIIIYNIFLFHHASKSKQ